VFEHFGKEGVAANESGLPPLGGFGGKPTMTNIAPMWAEQVRQGLLRPALMGDCVTQDNVGAPLYGPPNGGFDNRTNALFLASGPARALGLPSDFDMGSYVLKRRSEIGNTSCASFTACPGGVALVQDSVVREIIRFHFTANLAAWRRTYAAVKNDAAEAGRPEVAVYGNVHIVENSCVPCRHALPCHPPTCLFYLTRYNTIFFGSPAPNHSSFFSRRSCTLSPSFSLIRLPIFACVRSCVLSLRSPSFGSLSSRVCPAVWTLL